MTEKETTSGGAVWRKRAIASVSVAAAVCAMGVGFASSANAAPTAPKLTVTAPAKLANNGTSSSLFTIRVDNSASGNEAIPPVTTPLATTANLVVNVTLPTGLACSALTFTPGPTTSNQPNTVASPPLTALTTTTPGQCSFQTGPTFAQPANSNYLYSYNFSVNATAGATGSTGTITSNAALTETINGTATVVATSNSATTTLGTPAAPTVVAPTTPATIYQDYSFKVVTDSGTPSTPSVVAAPAGGVGYRVFQAPTQKTGNGGTTFGAGAYLTATTVPTTIGYGAAAGDAAFYLPSSPGTGCDYLDLVTGTITNGGGNCDQPDTTTDSTPAYSYTVIANNGVGGATQTSPGNASGTTAPPTPNTAVHDVATTPFTLQVLFSDVTVASTFGAEIYGLSDVGAIKGFADGTYRPGQQVTRQELVNILVNYDPASAIPSVTGNGECTTFEPSAFSDVPNSSIFCEAIKFLSQVNVIRGSGGGLFRPTAVVNRQEFSGILYRFYTLETTGNVLNGDATFTPPSSFKDVSDTNVFAGDIQFSVKKGFIKGYTDGTFRPASGTTRDATAALIFRAGVGI